MLFLSIFHGVNSVILFLRTDRKQKFQLDSSCINKGLSFGLLLECLACMTTSASEIVNKIYVAVPGRKRTLFQKLIIGKKNN